MNDNKNRMNESCKLIKIDFKLRLNWTINEILTFVNMIFYRPKSINI